MYKTLAVLITFLILASCDKEQLANTEASNQAYEVELLFSPHGLGDGGYNDLALYGISQAQKDLGFEIEIHNPQSIQEGWQCFEEWQKNSSEKKRLFIFCSNSYEELLRKASLPQDANSTILMYETEENVPGVVSFNIEGYGAAYCIGCLASVVSERAAVMLANEYDKNIASIAQGFADGYQSQHDMEVPFYYLANESNEGYAAEEDAYKLVTQLYQDYDFIFPIAGKSNQGLYRFTREYGRGCYTAGIDGDMSAYSDALLCSLVRRMDKVLYDYVKMWMERPEEMPQYKHYLLSDGYSEIVISEDYEEFFDENVDSATIVSTAITKEEEYVKK